MGALLANGAFFEKQDVVSLLHQAELLSDEQHGWRSRPPVLVQEPLDLQRHRQAFRAGTHLSLASNPKGAGIPGLSASLHTFVLLRPLHERWHRQQNQEVEGTENSRLPISREIQFFF